MPMRAQLPRARGLDPFCLIYRGSGAAMQRVEKGALVVVFFMSAMSALLYGAGSTMTCRAEFFCAVDWVSLGIARNKTVTLTISRVHIKQQKTNGSGTAHQMGMKGNKRKAEPRSSWTLQRELDAIMLWDMKEGVSGRRRKTKYMRSICVLFCKQRGH